MERSRGKVRNILPSTNDRRAGSFDERAARLALDRRIRRAPDRVVGAARRSRVLAEELEAVEEILGDACDGERWSITAEFPIVPVRWFSSTYHPSRLPRVPAPQSQRRRGRGELSMRIASCLARLELPGESGALSELRWRGGGRERGAQMGVYMLLANPSGC